MQGWHVDKDVDGSEGVYGCLNWTGCGGGGCGYGGGGIRVG